MNNDSKLSLKSIRTSSLGNVSEQPGQDLVEEVQTQSNIKSRQTNSELMKLSVEKVIGILIGLIIIGLIFFLVYSNNQAENFYKGKWSEVISQSEKDSGIKESLYEISENNMTHSLKSEDEASIREIKLIYELTPRANDSTGAYFYLKDLKIDSINLNFKNDFCNQDQAKCEQFQKEYRDNVNETIKKQRENSLNQPLSFIQIKNGLRIHLPVMNDIEAIKA
jgi:hypothetical protein